jgi:AcrR family transcriptional regulator
MNKDSTRARRRTGRPLSFDRGAALRQAMLVFWRHGYEATSLADLTAAMGVTAPSIYTAYGDKKRLFLEAVGLYLGGPVTAERIIDEAPSAQEAVARMLQTAAIGFTGPDTPRGCLLASSAISCSTDAADVQAELAGIRRAIEERLRQRIAADGIADAESVAAHCMALIQGMSTLARDGASREKLLRIASLAGRIWPAGQ